MLMARFGVLALCAAITSALLLTPQRTLAAQLCAGTDEPVCALDSTGVRTTYTNPCLAGQAHARVLHPGSCFGLLCSFNPVIVNSVCAADPKSTKLTTYANMCAAERANAKWVRYGACR